MVFLPILIRRVISKEDEEMIVEQVKNLLSNSPHKSVDNLKGAENYLSYLNLVGNPFIVCIRKDKLHF